MSTVDWMDDGTPASVSVIAESVLGHFGNTFTLQTTEVYVCLGKAASVYWWQKGEPLLRMEQCAQFDLEGRTWSPPP